jgi:hypothetical protein
MALNHEEKEHARLKSLKVKTRKLLLNLNTKMVLFMKKKQF